MITAHFGRAEKRLRLSVMGHAGYAEAGRDTVCAAVSGIVYALCGYLQNFNRKGLVIHSLSAGEADIECSEEGEEAMKLACIGLVQIMLSYPAYLTVLNTAFDWKTASRDE